MTIEKSLPDDAKHFIASVKPYCSSIILGGSWATQKADSSSDVDLCLVSPDARNKNLIYQLVRGTLQNRKEKRLHLDVKAYTQEEFTTLIQGIQNPYWYTFNRDGVLLFGEPLEVPLFRHTFSNSIWQTIEQVQEAIDFIEQRINLEIACYQLWTALSLSFTVDCLMRNEEFRKNSRIQLSRRLFGKHDKYIKEVYERVSLLRRTQLRAGMKLTDGQSLKCTRKSVSKPLDGIDTDTLHKCGMQVLSYCEKIYRQAMA